MRQWHEVSDVVRDDRSLLGLGRREDRGVGCSDEIGSVMDRDDVVPTVAEPSAIAGVYISSRRSLT